MVTDYSVGAIVQNSLKQFAKVISIKNGLYGISGWTTLPNAEKATIIAKYVNIYGLKYAGAVVVKADSSKATHAKAEKTSSEKFTKTQLNKMNAQEVKDLATKLKIDNSGNKKDVIERILAI